MSEFWKDDDVIYQYTAEQAIDDGVLTELFKHRWGQLSGGKPIRATTTVTSAFSEAALIEVWNDYVKWVQEVAPTLSEEDRMFTTTMNGQTIWLIDDGASLTMMFPEDY